ncbi:MAG: protein kinase, partial [Gammaproteobacteria bacterium]|nr:protein kinase [Gammaproteobacteria bacterium]
SIDKEVEAYARLGEHPNIAKCYGKQKIGTETVLVMELVEGQSAQEVFGDLLRRYNKGELNRSEYLGAMQHIIHGILMGLSQFEALGLAHLDIKADNIRIDSNTHEPKILDMGLVQSQDEALPDVPVPIKWMAPETMAKREVGPTSDSFGLGQTIFQQLERGGQFGSEATNAWQRQETDLKNLAAGPMFVPGKGTVNDGGNLYNRDFAHFDRQALTESGLPTAMPLTRASDQKLGNTPRAHGADPGKFGVETQYVDFMNRLMHPDPKLRMTPSEALRHPFMTDRLMSREELAKSVFPAKEAVQSNAANIEIDYDVQDVHQPPPRDEIVYLDEEDEQPPPPDSRKIDYTISQQDNDDYDKGNRQ